MTPEMMSAILGTGGMLGALVVIVPKIIDGLQANRSGKAVRERDRNRTLIQAARHAEDERDEARSQRDRAEVQADEMATKARKVAEYASRLRRQLYEAGLEPEEWPNDL